MNNGMPIKSARKRWCWGAKDTRNTEQCKDCSESAKAACQEETEMINEDDNTEHEQKGFNGIDE